MREDPRTGMGNVSHTLRQVHHPDIEKSGAPRRVVVSFRGRCSAMLGEAHTPTGTTRCVSPALQCIAAVSSIPNDLHEVVEATRIRAHLPERIQRCSRGCGRQDRQTVQAYIPNYFMHKLTGDGNFTRALARVDAVDMIVIPGRVPIRWSSRPVPPCLDSASWNVSWSAEGYVHERTAVDDLAKGETTSV